MESRQENGVWLTRSLTHGRMVLMKSESQILHACSESELAGYAKSVMPNRRSRKQTPVQKPPVETVQAAQDRRVRRRRPSVPEFGLTALDAAYRVLKEARKPLSSQEIVDLAFRKKYARSNGATPANTVHAAMLREIKAKGENARFVKVGRWMFTARGLTQFSSTFSPMATLSKCSAFGKMAFNRMKTATGQTNDRRTESPD